MACPTCDHTMESCTLTISHCPRCGTMIMDDRIYIPKLVDRCREFENWCKNAHGWIDTNHLAALVVYRFLLHVHC